ncbi:N-alpha-acetyltransferase 80 isoform X1 [Cotesia typhae]|uniref:N-alpha-acetyltransferase 80 isoform X1 n=2 Tax=Cotesia typhae TaxID=2053667 RepID=UPI003D69DFDF
MILGILTRGINSIMEMINMNLYTIIPIHERPDLYMDCCKLINSEWPSSDTRRLRTLRMSCDNFPTCLILIIDNKVIGHCKISLVPKLNGSCFIESVVIDSEYRYRGLGSILLRGTEKYVLTKNIKSIYLATKGQEQFYQKNGYYNCEPIDLWDCRTVSKPIDVIRKKYTQKEKCSGPPPPPLPNLFSFKKSKITTSKTYMVKHL